MALSPRRHFLPWDRPLLPQAAAWLAGDWRGDGPLDLSAQWVIVPTRQAGRRLREALAEHAAQRGQAVFPPRVLTPEALVTEAAGTGVAPRLEALLAWTEVFRGIEPEEFRAVWPVDPPEHSFAWAARLAAQFSHLQATLAEAGLKLADVAPRMGDDFPERERWVQLGELERRQAEKLAEFDLRETQAAKIAVAQRPVGDAAVSRIVLLATPDPLPLAVSALAATLAERVVEVVIFASEDEGPLFDDWGRPLAAAWEKRELALPEFKTRVHLCADPAAQAERIVATARKYAQPEGAIAVGVADPEVLPLLEGELVHAGLQGFSPEGRARSSEPLYQLLVALAGLAREANWETVAALARCPDFLAWLRARRGPQFSAARFLSNLDQVREDHLPADLAAAIALGGERVPELAEMAELRTMVTRASFPQNLSSALTEIFLARRLDLGREADQRLEEAAVAWTEVGRQCATAKERFPAVPEADWWELALRIYGEERRSEEKPPGALELQGWLELLFEDAPHLAVAGLNDGFVPSALTGDAFLPESLRAQLGLKTNAARFAADAYLLQAAVASRAEGRVDVFFGKTSVAGEPLRPSRLLLRCADADLPERVAFLFREPAAAHAALPWTRAWKLQPGDIKLPQRVAVTALRAWLDCPFRFYLRHTRRMLPVDPTKEEMDARDFGTLMHAALEALALETPLHDCADASVLREFLFAALERRARAKYGNNLTLALTLQLESARQRISKAAEIEATERADGWRTVAAEREFLLDIAGLKVAGKIDRIDRHRDTGAVRVLDYKTSDTAVTPAEAHLRSLRRDETPPAWAIFGSEDRVLVWKDLQLPLYERVLAAEFGGGVTCGYFNLPKAVGESGLSLWTDFSPALRESAWRCAEGVSAAICAGEFWPPRELKGRDAERDDYAELFHHGAAASVEWPTA